jgi:hypothetical protein
MKALSLWQPHVAAIALELKPWETRSWSTEYRGPLALHAAKRAWDDIDDWHGDASTRLTQRCSELITTVCPEVDPEHHRRARKYLHERVLLFGAVICIADLVDCVRTEWIRGKIPPEHEFWGDFSDGRYAFKLKNVRLLDRAIYYRGQQGFFDVDLGASIEPPAPDETAPMQMGLFGGE